MGSVWTTGVKRFDTGTQGMLTEVFTHVARCLKAGDDEALNFWLHTQTRYLSLWAVDLDDQRRAGSHERQSKLTVWLRACE